MSKSEQEARPGTRRAPLEDRVAVRFPTLATNVNSWIARAVLGMPRRWRLRQLFFEYSARRAFDAIARGDLDVLRTTHHADVVYDMSRSEWPEATLYHGRDGLVRFNEEWIGQWSEPSFDVVSVEELDERGVLLVHVDLRGRGRTSGLDVKTDVFELVTVRQGLIWRIAFLPSRAAAIETAIAQSGSHG